MTAGGRDWIRNNLFVVAAVALPALVVALFALAAAVPRWRVPPPRFDLVFSADRPGRSPARRFAVEYHVREGRIVADVRPAPANSYPPEAVLYRFDHETQDVREVPVELPADVPDDAGVITVEVDELAGRAVLPRAPDGYAFELETNGGPGLIGDLFGMRRYGQRGVLVRDGRVIPLDLPASYAYGLKPLGWLGNGGTP